MTTYKRENATLPKGLGSITKELCRLKLDRQSRQLLDRCGTHFLLLRVEAGLYFLVSIFAAGLEADSVIISREIRVNDRLSPLDNGHPLLARQLKLFPFHKLCDGVRAQ